MRLVLTEEPCIRKGAWLRTRGVCRNIDRLCHPSSTERHTSLACITPRRMCFHWTIFGCYSAPPSPLLCLTAWRYIGGTSWYRQTGAGGGGAGRLHCVSLPVGQAHLYKDEISGGFIKGILRGVRCTNSLRVLFLHRRPPSQTTLVLYSRAVFIFNEPASVVE